MYFTYTGGPVFRLASYDAVIRGDPRKADAFLSRGRLWYGKKEYDRAIADYDAAIRINPQLAAAYVGRGIAWRAKGDLDRALTDFDTAVGIEPQSAVALANRGNAWYEKKAYDRAIADLTSATEINPKLAMAYVDLGAAKHRTGDVSGLITDYAHAIEADPNLAVAHNQLARELATAENPSLRDGPRAVESALKACELTNWTNPHYVDTLAAAYARAGNFDDAIKSQRKAMEYPGQVNLAGDDNAANRLKLYEEGKAWPPD
jgi:tetratricopeptide (TPR) repeat protein